MSNIVGTNELAKILGVSTRSIREWANNGCPIEKRGRKGDGVGHQFKTSDVINWLKDRAASEAVGNNPDAQSAEDAKRRKLVADATLAELELAKAKGLIAPLDQIERVMANAFAEVKVNMRNIPHRVVMQLLGETDEVRFKEVLTSEIDQALTALAELELTDEV